MIQKCKKLRIGILRRFDALHIAKLDHRYSYFEERWITLGATGLNKILVVANLVFTEEIIRIFSARKATEFEVKQYEIV
ncbi:MAG: BrnT family toxin [Thiotrichales bacterium]|nr:BrnT family toxin [Thiotrichales bacterium]